jgi:MFS family permease
VNAPAREPAAEEFRLRSVAVSAFAPATLFGIAEGAMVPVIAASCFARGASTAVAAVVAALLGIASFATNIPSGVLATRVGERRAMLVAAVITAVGLILCIPDLGRSAGSLAVYGLGVFCIGSASSVYVLARQAYLTEMVPVPMRARALSTLGGTMRIGLFVGPFIGAGAVALIGLAGAYCVGIAAILIAAAIVVRVPDLELSEAKRAASADVHTMDIVRRHWHVLVTLGMGVLALSAIRQTRQSVIPLWAHHIGLSPSTSSLIYGVAGAIDALTFYPAGKVMDLYGRRAVAVPCVVIMSLSFVLMPLTRGAPALLAVGMLMGFGNGIGSGIVMTFAADTSPEIGRLRFLGVWRELADAGAGIGPLILAAVTALAGLGAGLIVSGGAVGALAAGALWRWSPRGKGTRAIRRPESGLTGVAEPARRATRS